MEQKIVCARTDAQPCALTRLHAILSRSMGLQDLSLEWDEVRQGGKEKAGEIV